ncbi:MAG: D-alanyl-D-alanine carboxypeptidase, partial [Alphaproteobacteria bacterium]
MPSRDALSRRAFLAGAAALMPAALSARAPETALPPRPRPAPPPRAAEAALDPGLSGSSGLALLDVASGTMLEALRPDAPFRPASVSKIPTALYALEALGPRHRFVTRLVARGALRGGVLEGDLHLIGGGDPALDSDGLASVAEAAARAGIRRVAGRFVVDASALPAIERIDADQPVAAAYNPAVAGLNLNFNRVLVEWDGQAGERIAVEARALRHSPPVDCVRVAADPAAGPVFTHQLRGGVEYWRIAAAALRGRGGRWLPVRRPAVYAAEVFARLAGAAGIALPPAEAGPAPGAGREIARIE